MVQLQIGELAGLAVGATVLLNVLFAGYTANSQIASRTIGFCFEEVKLPFLAKKLNYLKIGIN